MITTRPAATSSRTAAATTDPPPPANRGLRRSALVAGSALLVLAVLSAAANFGVIQRLVTPGDATRTARDILASAGLFRLGIAALFVVVILDIVLIGYLACKSGYVPRVLGVLLVIAGAGYLAGSFSALLTPGHAVNVAAFTFIGEALFMLWLLAKGRNITPKA